MGTMQSENFLCIKGTHGTRQCSASTFSGTRAKEVALVVYLKEVVTHNGAGRNKLESQILNVRERRYKFRKRLEKIHDIETKLKVPK